MYLRVIPRLDIKGPNLVKGIHLEGLRVLGKPADFARHYYQQGADELLQLICPLLRQRPGEPTLGLYPWGSSISPTMPHSGSNDVRGLATGVELIRAYSQNKIQALLNRVISGRFKVRLIWLFHKWAERQLRNRGHLDFLKARPPGAFAPNFSDLWFLYRTIRSRKPRCVLEFGSGCSTVIFAQALSDNRNGSSKNGERLYSVDADRDWTEVTTKSMPSRLEGMYEICHSPVLEVEFEGTPAWRYAKFPEVVPDLIYLDGPPLTDARQVAVDVLDIEDRLNPGCCLIVDGRVQNIRFLRKHLKRHWKFKHRWFFRNSVFELVA